MASIAVILLANLALGLAMTRYLSNVWLNEVRRRVDLDLNSARAAYEGHARGIQRFLCAASLDRVLVNGVGHRPPTDTTERIDLLLDQGQMDFLVLTDAAGQVFYRSRNAGISGDSLSSNLLVKSVLEHRQPLAGTIVLSRESLNLEGAELAERAQFRLLPTVAAKPTHETSRSEGMVLAAAVPVLSRDGSLVGVLYGGDLLNRRYEIVDAIRDQVFTNEEYEGRDIGTVTIFQGDLRIATNVEMDDGTRAVATRLSTEVYDQVLERGVRWNDRAFVVNDWYVTAYEPIRDPSNRIIGALYVGLREAPFAHRKWLLQGVFLGIVTMTTGVSLVLLLFATRLMLRPISPVIDMCRRVVEGDLDARVGIRPKGEMGELCAAVDRMADAVCEREEKLKTATQQQIGQSEKLASIGRLAAGVAHEINNPLTGVLTFAHLLKDKEHFKDEDRHDLDLIINETSRVAEIVRGLLDFARERKVVREPIDINEVIRRTVRLIRGQKLFQSIDIIEQLDDQLPKVSGDVNQLQQVLLNLSLNASEAMPEGGSLTVRTYVEDGRIHLDVIDTGCGIQEEHLGQIFEPFFSTKPPGKGTGLGLSVSYGIIDKHGGELKVKSRPDRGTTFSIVLPTTESQQDS